MPSLMHCCTHLNSNQLLSPENLKYFKESTAGFALSFVNAIFQNSDGSYPDFMKLENLPSLKMAESDAIISSVGNECSESNKERFPEGLRPIQRDMKCPH
ncbi:hypothetical protein SLE2022_263380 [Rubroshorea leprosula]